MSFFHDMIAHSRSSHVKIIGKLPAPDEPTEAPQIMPPLTDAHIAYMLDTLDLRRFAGPSNDFAPPTLSELGVDEAEGTEDRNRYAGGEMEALRRMEEFLKTKRVVAEVWSCRNDDIIALSDKTFIMLRCLKV